MDDDVKVLERIYARFNARDIDGVLAVLADDVIWANGMDGGHVHGREAVREYWTRQWTMVSPYVEPLGFSQTTDGAIIAEVRRRLQAQSQNSNPETPLPFPVPSRRRIRGGEPHGG
jgi:ketosteroid isomerase-like protein